MQLLRNLLKFYQEAWRRKPWWSILGLFKKACSGPLLDVQSSQTPVYGQRRFDPRFDGVCQSNQPSFQSLIGSASLRGSPDISSTASWQLAKRPAYTIHNNKAGALKGHTLSVWLLKIVEETKNRKKWPSNPKEINNELSWLPVTPIDIL